jgi:hypothetical protein
VLADKELGIIYRVGTVKGPVWIKEKVGPCDPDSDHIVETVLQTWRQRELEAMSSVSFTGKLEILSELIGHHLGEHSAINQDVNS